MSNQFYRILAFLLFSVMATFNCRAEKIFEELASNPHVESIYVGKGMMGMARNFLANSSDNDTKTAFNAIKDINSIEIINCDNKSAISEIKTKARNILNKLKLEIVLETKEQNESTIIYGRNSSKNKNSTISDMVIETSEPSEYTLIYINGVIDINALTKQ